MTGKRTAAIAAGAAAGAIALGAAAGVLRHRRVHAPAPDPPPDLLEPVVSFDGTTIAVRAAGDPDAPQMVFVHGLGLDMSTWHEQWTALSDEFRCVLMDQRSHGASGRAREDVSLRGMGLDVAAVLDSVARDRPVVLVGHSMGAMAIVSMAGERPELFGSRVAGVALLGAATGNLVRGAVSSFAGLFRPGSVSAAARRVGYLGRALLASPTDPRAAVARLTQFAPGAPAHVVQRVIELAGKAPLEVWSDGLLGLMEADLGFAVSMVQVPSLVLVGEHDLVTPPAAAVRLAASLPRGRLVVLEGAGHMAMLERPDELNRELRAFARRCLPGRNSGPVRRKTRKRPA